MIHLIDLITIISLGQNYYKNSNCDFLRIELAYTLFIIIIIIIIIKIDNYFKKELFYEKIWKCNWRSKSNYLILKLFQTSINLILYSKMNTQTLILQDMEL
jgi:hypothetical protein